MEKNINQNVINNNSFKNNLIYQKSRHNRKQNFAMIMKFYISQKVGL